MNMSESWRLVLDLIQVILVPILGMGMRTLNELYREIRAINGRLVSLEQWRSDHIVESDRRFKDWIAIARRHGFMDLDK